MKTFLTLTGRILVVVSGLLLAWGFQSLYGKYSNQLETLNHIPYGRFYVACLIVGIFMIIKGNRLPY
jgi:TRAP-type C4-dicarboxylate transport system permease small subunit